MFGLGPPELIIVLVIAVLLFGKRLPEVARSLGKGMMEFKKGIQGVEEEVDRTKYSLKSARFDDDRDDATAPKFEPPAGEPSSSESNQTAG